jgi:hypothetical protein
VAKRPKRVGVILTTVGISGGIFFSLFAVNNDFVGDSRNDALIYNAIVTNVGVSLWISGGIIAANNKKAMEKIKPNADLSFRTTNNGVGLVMRF